MKHKHYKEIVAWAEGKTIENRQGNTEPWEEYIGVLCPTFSTSSQYRIKEKLTVAEVYKAVYDLHYKFLTKNHMSEDRSRRSATIYAVRHTWSTYNEQ
jgi:hypothetical protein